MLSFQLGAEGVLERSDYASNNAIPDPVVLGCCIAVWHMQSIMNVDASSFMEFLEESP